MPHRIHACAQQALEIGQAQQHHGGRVYAQFGKAGGIRARAGLLAPALSINFAQPQPEQRFPRLARLHRAKQRQRQGGPAVLLGRGIEFMNAVLLQRRLGPAVRRRLSEVCCQLEATRIEHMFLLCSIPVLRNRVWK
jgi:hypothetical protein